MQKLSASHMPFKSPQRMAVTVKICGITNSEDASLAIKAGADALGFNFYAKSPRKIGISRAREIICQLPREVTAVGVFVNSPAADILKIARATKLGAVQLHGNENPGAVARVARHIPVIKAFRVGPSFDMKQVKRYPAATAFLLDGYDRQLRGGTGNTFDWSIARSRSQIAPLILAGGLKKQNVRRAIQSSGSSAVDICSAIESWLGKKDPKKMREFLRAVGRRFRKAR